MSKRSAFLTVIIITLLIDRLRLIVDSLTRPTPKDMLGHPWIINMMKHENGMARWVGQVWGWNKSRRSRDE